MHHKVQNMGVDVSHLDPDELPTGTKLELTYDGARGARTITTYVVAAFDPSPSLDGDRYNDLRVRAAEPTARRPRFVQFTVNLATGEDSTLLKSLNSKAKRGRKLGLLLDITITGRTSREHAAVGELIAADAGDVVTVNGTERVVVKRRCRSIEVEPRGGGERTTYYGTSTGVREEYYYDTTDLAVERTGERVRNGDAAVVLEAIADYGHGHDDGAVEAILYEGTRYDVVYRHDGRKDGIRLASPTVDEVNRPWDTRLTLDPIGLRLTTGIGTEVAVERIAAEDLTLVREADSEDDQDVEQDASEFGSHVMADGGRAETASDGECTLFETDPAAYTREQLAAYFEITDTDALVHAREDLAETPSEIPMRAVAYVDG